MVVSWKYHSKLSKISFSKLESKKMLFQYAKKVIKNCCNTTDQFHDYRQTLQTNIMTTDEHYRPVSWLQINTTYQFHDYRSIPHTNFMTKDQYYRPTSWLQISIADQFHDYRSTLQTNFMTTDQHCRPISWLPKIDDLIICM